MTNPERPQHVAQPGYPPSPERGQASAQPDPPLPGEPAPDQEWAQAQPAGRITGWTPTSAAGFDSGVVIGRPPALPPPPSLPLPPLSPALANAAGTIATAPSTGHLAVIDEATTAAGTAVASTAANTATASTVAASTAAAATALTAQPVAGQLTRARAIPDAGRQDPPGSAPDDPTPPPGHGLAGLAGRLSRLRIGSHTIARASLGQLRLTSPGSGLILGADRHQKPVALRIFRPAPTLVTLVGGAWVSQLLALRALALDARVVVITADPLAWQGFGERATGRGDRVTVMPAERPLVLAATAQQPVLVIYDLGLPGATSPQPLGPWQTQVTVLRNLEQSGVPLVHDGDLVMLQRLSSEEARIAGRTLRLRAPSTQFLQVMADDMIALVADGGDRYIWFAQTAMEREILGTPRR